MIAQAAGDLFHRHVDEPGVVEDAPRRLCARHARLHADLAILAIGRMQFDLRPDAEEDSGQDDDEIQWVEYHKLVNLHSIDSTFTVSIQTKAARVPDRFPRFYL